MSGTLSFKLDVFEGPLDLLLHLISKHKLNINDIPIAILVEQYLEYITSISDEDYETAGEFLEMAARLIYIKTVSLLPHSEEEAAMLKKDLEGKLIEYSLCKITAQNMKDIYIGNVITVREPMKLKIDVNYSLIHAPEELKVAYLGISVKRRDDDDYAAKKAFNNLISHKVVAVSTKIVYLLRRLYKEGKCGFDDVFSGMTDKSERVATFLAVLELTKSGRILLNDDNTEITFNKVKIKDSEGTVTAQ